MNDTAEKMSFEGSPIDCKPFVKWAGGKRQLLPELISRLPAEINNYFEPFLGGGALFFKLQKKNSFLSDLNQELIDCYIVVRDQVESLISELSSHVYVEDYYYQIRNVDRQAEFLSWSKVKKAARLIFLNKTCFNGLYRVNSSGYFNVPFGRYVDPTICDPENLRACSLVLQEVDISCCSFSSILDKAQQRDFVYFDPPYAPISATSNFTSYNKDKFNSAMQIELRDVCIELDKKSVNFMLSNSSAPLIFDLYKDFRISSVSASRSVNSKALGRGKIEELIITNY